MLEKYMATVNDAAAAMGIAAKAIESLIPLIQSNQMPDALYVRKEVLDRINATIRQRAAKRSRQTRQRGVRLYVKHRFSVWNP